GRQAQAHHPRASRLRGSRGGRRDPSGRHPRLRSGAGRDRREVTRLLDGIRVIDAANFIAGPVSTTVMADFGADVIKIEPPTGDGYRVRGVGYPPSPYNFPWIVDNRSKRSVAIDLRSEDGQRVLHRLVQSADVFVTNLPLDARHRLRVRYEDLAPLNARLIYASLTAYGETGDEAGRPGFGSTALWPGPASWISSVLRRSRRPRARCPAWAITPRACRSSARSWRRSTSASGPAAAGWSRPRSWPTASGGTRSRFRASCAAR